MGRASVTHVPSVYPARAGDETVLAWLFQIAVR